MDDDNYRCIDCYCLLQPHEIDTCDDCAGLFDGRYDEDDEADYIYGVERDERE